MTALLVEQIPEIIPAGIQEFRIFLGQTPSVEKQIGRVEYLVQIYRFLSEKAGAYTCRKGLEYFLVGQRLPDSAGDSFRNSIRIAGFAYRSTLRSRTIECASTRRARTTNRRRISSASAASPGAWLFFPDLDRLGFLPFLLSCTKKLLTANRITDAEHGNGVVVLLPIGEKAELGRTDRAGARQIEV